MLFPCQFYFLAFFPASNASTKISFCKEISLQMEALGPDATSQNTFCNSMFRIFNFCISVFPHFQLLHFHVSAFSTFAFPCFRIFIFSYFHVSVFSYFRIFVFSCIHILYTVVIFIQYFLRNSSIVIYSLYWHRLYII